MCAKGPSLEQLKGTALFHRLQEFGRERSFEETHALKVTDIALQLFDGLVPLHGMGDGERMLLLSAAMLHDLGMCKGIRGHHKSSLEIIMAGDLHPLSEGERSMVASIARYHRKAHPRRKHDHFSALKEDQQAVVSRTASILRMADALDRSHQNAVSAVDVEISSRKIKLRATSANDLSLEQDALRKKGKLFEELFGMRPSLEAARPRE
jgi:exopolyphosphatase/guanosine-5'-triphosphate,3'-diphosphate pyrophosphatase